MFRIMDVDSKSLNYMTISVLDYDVCDEIRWWLNAKGFELNEDSGVYFGQMYEGIFQDFYASFEEYF